MATTVSLSDKKAFLNWFIGEFQFKNRESMYLIKYISKKESILNLVRFVDDITFCPRAMMISTEDADEQSFMYRKQHVYTVEAEKAFHDIRIDREDHIYIQLNFKNRNKMLKYVAVVEENPFFEPDLSKQYGSTVEQLITQLTMNTQIEKLKKNINAALDQGNKDLFLKFSNQLKELQEDDDSR